MRASRVAIAALAGCIIAACGAFGASTEPAPNGALPDGAPADGNPDGLDGGGRPDGARTGDGGCGHRGAAAPCTSCVASEVSVPGVPFGLHVTDDALYYVTLEKVDANDDPRGGLGVGALHRMALAGGMTTTLAQGLSAPSWLAASNNTLFIATNARLGTPAQLLAIPLSCTSSCAPTLFTTLSENPWNMVATRRGVAIIGSAGVTIVDPGVGTSLVPMSLGAYKGISASGNRLLIGASTLPDAVMLRDDGRESARFKLPDVDGGATGILIAAMECDRAALLRTTNRGVDVLSWLDFTSGAFSAAVDVQPLVFAMAIDATHTYVAKPNGNGLWRYDATGKGTNIAPGKDVWRIAIDDTHVYFDDHGANKIYSLAKE